MNIIHVCHITSAHPDDDVRIFYKECVSLSKAGYKVSFIVPNTQQSVNEGVEFVNVVQKNESRLYRMLILTRKIYRIARKTDAVVYHFHDPELLPAGLKLAKSGKKVIYDAHEDLPKALKGRYWINKSLRSVISYLIEKYENRLARRFSAIITATPAIAERFKKINQHTFAINNFPFLNEFEKQQAIVNENRICYVGAISRIRCIKEMVMAMNLTENIVLDLAGKFDPPELINEVKEISGWGNINNHGYVDRKGAAEILGKAKAGLVLYYPLPNHIDAQPNKIFEYMSAGIPVIASNFPLWKEIVEKNNCGICVDPLNVNEIADAVNFLMQNQDIAEEMGRNGRKAIENHYNWEAEEKKLLRVYEELT